MIPLKDYLEALLPDTSPYWILTPRQAQLIQALFPNDAMNTYVLENNPETRGLNGLVLPLLGAGEFRLWHRKDWELADNKRQQILRNMDMLQAARLNHVASLKATIKAYFLKGGVITDAIADKMLNDITDVTQLEQLASKMV